MARKRRPGVRVGVVLNQPPASPPQGPPCARPWRRPTSGGEEERLQKQCNRSGSGQAVFFSYTRNFALRCACVAILSSRAYTTMVPSTGLTVRPAMRVGGGSDARAAAHACAWQPPQAAACRATRSLGRAAAPSPRPAVAAAAAPTSVPTTKKTQPFPFVKIAAQDELKLALLLNCVDASCGGLLVMGDRGTAKSVAVSWRRDADGARGCKWIGSGSRSAAHGRQKKKLSRAAPFSRPSQPHPLFSFSSPVPFFLPRSAPSPNCSPKSTSSRATPSSPPRPTPSSWARTAWPGSNRARPCRLARSRPRSLSCPWVRLRTAFAGPSTSRRRLVRV